MPWHFRQAGTWRHLTGGIEAPAALQLSDFRDPARQARSRCRTDNLVETSNSVIANCPVLLATVSFRGIITIHAGTKP
jgi:hypothetical protein